MIKTGLHFRLKEESRVWYQAGPLYVTFHFWKKLSVSNSIALTILFHSKRRKNNMAKTIFIIREKVSNDPRFGISRMYREWPNEFDTQEDAEKYLAESDCTNPCEVIETERDYTDEEINLDRADYLYEKWREDNM
jgi:hypothetical protein